MKKIIPFLFIVSTLIFQACNNKDVAAPAATVSAAQQTTDAVAAALKKPSPGNYYVKLYVENGDTSTAQFKGHMFNFKANGQLIATVDSSSYTGKWESKDGGKKLKLDIEGTEALKDIDKSWDVLSMTQTQISLKDNSGKFGNKLLFEKTN